MPKTEKVAEAVIDAASGLAVVVEPSGKIYILRHDEPGRPEDGDGVHLGMLLQPAMTPLETRDADAFPYPELYRHLDLSYRRHAAVRMTLSALDGEFSAELRQECAAEAEKLLTADEIRSFVRELFLKVPLPPAFVLEQALKENRLGTLLREASAKWGR